MREYDENVEDAEDEGGNRAAEAAFDAGQDHNNAAHQKEDAGPDTGEASSRDPFLSMLSI